nr:nitrate- and nitrite sensing domain-containing protein [Kushneria phosphatilytica]
MTSSTLERLLAAANASDIDRLHQLTALCALVGPLCQLVHTLQRERGASSIVLGSRGQRFITRYQTHVADSQTAEAALHAALEHWMTAPGEAAHEVHARDPRLLRRLADAVNEAEALARLRARVEQQQVTADEATRLYNRTIGTLLSVVFEVADTASDADITRVLVSLFHFIQGKELAGQERACGALGFTLGHFDEPHRHTLQTTNRYPERLFRDIHRVCRRDAADPVGSAHGASGADHIEPSSLTGADRCSTAGRAHSARRTVVRPGDSAHRRHEGARGSARRGAAPKLS